MARRRREGSFTSSVGDRAPVPRSGRVRDRLVVVLGLALSMVTACTANERPPSVSVGPSSSPPIPPAPDRALVARCDGVRVGPRADLQAVIDGHPEGTTFCVRPGVHKVADGVRVRSGDRLIGARGAVLDGLGVAPYGIYGFGTETGQNDVRVEGLVIQNVDGPGVKAGWNWRMEGIESRRNEVGVMLNRGSILRGSAIHHNTRYGVLAGPSRGVRIVSNEVAFNNTADFCGGSCEGDAGGSKIVGSVQGTYGVVWRRNWVHDNTGNGIWSDGNVHDALYEQNVVESNSGSGIFHEISWDATIRKNVVRGNATASIGSSCWWGAQVQVNNSQNVVIVDNDIDARNGANGVCVVDAVRPQTAPFSDRLASVDVTRNTIRIASPGTSGLVGRTARDIRFDRNRYEVADLTGAFWAWLDRYPITWSEFRIRSGETRGSRSLIP